MKKTKLLILLFIIFFTAIAFRLYRLAEVPPGLSVDEVANAYNGYSLIARGTDEYGVVLPLYFRSFNDFKPPVTIYTLVPSLFIGGNDIFQVRFPPAVFGSLTSLLIFYILIRMGFSIRVSFISSIWFAINPWHVRLSRETLETVIALFFTLLGLAGFLGWRDKRSYSSALAFGLGFGLGLWTYHAQKIFIPMLIIFILYPLRKTLRNWKMPITVFLMMFIPLIFLTITKPQIFSRSNATSIFNDNGLKTLRSKAVTRVEEVYSIYSYWAKRYLSYFDIRYWFWDGLNLTANDRIDSGLFLIADLIPILAGFIFLIRKKTMNKSLIIFWFIVGILPASITMDDRHVIRSLVWIFPFIFIFALFIKYCRSRFLITIYIVSGILSLFMFSDLYFRKFNLEMGEYFSYGYREIAQYACTYKNNFNQIFVSEAYGEIAQLTAVPQLFLGFYCRDYPQKFLSLSNQIAVKRPYWIQDKYNFPNSLFIAAPWDYPISQVSDSQIIKRIYFPNGKLAFIFVQTQPSSPSGNLRIPTSQ